MAQHSIVELPSQLTADTIEHLHQQLLSSTITRVIIPPRINFKVGAESAFIHWASNWAWHSPPREFLFRSDPTDNPETESVELPYIQAAAICGSKLLSNATAPGNARQRPTTIRQEIFSRQGHLFTKRELVTGQAILCVDSLDIPLPSRLYYFDGDIPKVKDQGQFESIFEELTSGKNSVTPLFGVNENQGIESSVVPQFVYELFRNTDDHAKMLSDGTRVPFSLRGMYTRLYRGTRASLANPADLSLDQYLINVCRNLRLDSNSSLTLLEIAIFDSGPGLAQHRSRKQLSLLTTTEERKWFEACFQPHSTAVSAEYNRGLGLDRVQRNLSELQALLRVRSGRLSMYRDFASLPFGNKVIFSDTSTLGPRPKEHSEVKGALFSVIVPCRELA